MSVQKELLTIQKSSYRLSYCNEFWWILKYDWGKLLFFGFTALLAFAIADVKTELKSLKGGMSQRNLVP